MAQRAAAIAVAEDVYMCDNEDDAIKSDDVVDDDVDADQHQTPTAQEGEQQDTRPAPRTIAPSAGSVGARLAAAKATKVGDVRCNV